MNCQFCNSELIKNIWVSEESHKDNHYLDCMSCRTCYKYDLSFNLLDCVLTKNNKKIYIDYTYPETFFIKDGKEVFTLNFTATNINPTNFDEKFGIYTTFS